MMVSSALSPAEEPSCFGWCVNHAGLWCYQSGCFLLLLCGRWEQFGSFAFLCFLKKNSRFWDWFEGNGGHPMWSGSGYVWSAGKKQSITKEVIVEGTGTMVFILNGGPVYYRDMVLYLVVLSSFSSVCWCISVPPWSGTVVCSIITSLTHHPPWLFSLLKLCCVSYFFQVVWCWCWCFCMDESFHVSGWSPRLLVEQWFYCVFEDQHISSKRDMFVLICPHLDSFHRQFDHHQCLSVLKQR